ncbi:hypothetical protein R4Z10_18960 [Niallia sp. XMNu-256]|uniref:hypothetical protein n=1 Tax=Niallia sp. XMNu-256 TaxID=3082444 RepID=UPI0030D127D2
MQSNQEEKFFMLKDVALGRLSPDRIPMFFWGSLIYSAVATGVSLFGILQNEHLITPLIKTMFQVSMISFLLHLLFTLFYSIPRMSYKFQRFQMVIVSLITIKVSLEAYQFFFVASITGLAPDYVINTGIIVLIGGFVYFIISLIRGIKRVQQGELKKGGKGLYEFKSSKAYISIPIIFAASMLGGSIGRNFSDPSTSFGLFFALFLCAVLQYTIAMAWPEFLLVTYAKYKFKSFNVKY